MSIPVPETVTDNQESSRNPRGAVYIETYGCQMNFNDSEIVAAILKRHGWQITQNPDQADIVLLNTCAIREKAEERVKQRIRELQAQFRRAHRQTLIGVLGCMAERMRKELIEQGYAEIVCGPDAYRSLPVLIDRAATGQEAVNVLLSREETYEDIEPVRLHSNGVSAFVSIIRGCNKMCTFCVVPFTRGRERSRPPESILREVRQLVAQGYREVVLLGQNVDSYRWVDNHTGQVVRFADLLAMVARISPWLRVRFSTSHPRDMTEDVLAVMSQYPNICKHIHLPVQSGSTRVLHRMRRGYTREWYLALIDRIRQWLPDVAITTDIIAGFCGETEEDHEETLTLMEAVRFDQSFMFRYSERPRTYAQRHYRDDVPLEVKIRRLNEIIALQREHSLQRNQQEIGKIRRVLIEGTATRSTNQWAGRTSQNKMVVFARDTRLNPGDYVDVEIVDCTSATLIGGRWRKVQDIREPVHL